MRGWHFLLDSHEITGVYRAKVDAGRLKDAVSNCVPRCRSTRYQEWKQNEMKIKKEHCSLRAYAKIFLGHIDSRPNPPKQVVESNNVKQDMKLGFLNLAKNLSLGSIPRSAKGESY